MATPWALAAHAATRALKIKGVELMKVSWVFSVYSFSKSKYDKIPPARCKNLTDLCTSLHNHCHTLGIASTSCYQSPVDIGINILPRLGCLRSLGKCNPLHWVALITSSGYQRTIRRQSIWNSLHPKHPDSEQSNQPLPILGLQPVCSVAQQSDACK